MNKALSDIYYDHGTWVHMWAQLHDAVYIYCDEAEIPMVMKTVREKMLVPLTCNGMTFMIDVDFSIGDTWGDMEEVEYTDYVKEEAVCCGE
jgi:DNA polymerase I-like protein with 3'-5' exonuclease and polymerase domains